MSIRRRIERLEGTCGIKHSPCVVEHRQGEELCEAIDRVEAKYGERPNNPIIVPAKPRTLEEEEEFLHRFCKQQLRSVAKVRRS